MVISTSISMTRAAEGQTRLTPKAQSAEFQQQLQTAWDKAATTAVQAVSTKSASAAAETNLSQSAAWPDTDGFYATADITYNGQKVRFDQLPAEVQKQMRAEEEKRAGEEAYRIRVANDPDVGPLAKIRPYDPAVDEVAMMGLATMDPATAHMTPERYYNYLGSDRAKYDTLLRAADADPALTPMAKAERQIFGPNLEQESKVEMIRDIRAKGGTLPESYVEFEQAWRSNLTLQAALQEERHKLPDL